jgi:sarcosine oxidase/L-pipecolate oxidase
MLRYTEGWGATLDPNGGILIAHRCLTAVQSRFLALGGRILTGCVDSVEPQGSAGVRVVTRSGTNTQTDTLSFDRAVICAGPWTARLLPQLRGILRSLLTPVTYWRDTTGSYSASSGFPILFNARLADVYGIPSYEYHGLVKMLFHGGPETDPDTRDLVSFSRQIEMVSRYVREHLPLLNHSKPAILESCMYTMTPDSNPVIDRLADNLVAGCGFSGSGFKHSPATGYMLAALALEQDEIVPQGFRADRYAMARFQTG